MGWTRNKRAVGEGFPDLEYMPKDRSGWDCTLASLAYALRLAVDRRPPDLSAWAWAHGVPASARNAELGDSALVLWHGTSAVRAEKIRLHGLAHKGGVWTTTNPVISHSFCRSRSNRFDLPGAVVCIVVDKGPLEEGRHYSREGNGDVYRFHASVPPELVEYILTPDRIAFTGSARARDPSPLPQARFKRRGGEWIPVQNAPQFYPAGQTYSKVGEYCRLCLGQLFTRWQSLSALEIFSCLYSCVQPGEALTHEDLFGLLEDACASARKQGRWLMFGPGALRPE